MKGATDKILRISRITNPVLMIQSLLLFMVAILGVICIFVVLTTARESYSLLSQRRIALNNMSVVLSIFADNLNTTDNPKNNLILVTKNELRFVGVNSIAHTFKCTKEGFVFDDNILFSESIARCEIKSYDKNNKLSYDKNSIERVLLYLSVEAGGYGLFSAEKDVWVGRNDYYEKFVKN